LGKRFDGSTRSFGDRLDFNLIDGRSVDVKWMDRARGRLIVNPTDPPKDVYVLVSGIAERGLTVKGWCTRSELIVGGRRNPGMEDLGFGPKYTLWDDELRPFLSLERLEAAANFRGRWILAAHVVTAVHPVLVLQEAIWLQKAQGALFRLSKPSRPTLPGKPSVQLALRRSPTWADEGWLDHCLVGAKIVGAVYVDKCVRATVEAAGLVHKDVSPYRDEAQRPAGLLQRIPQC
jgi:hypothetical protein